MLELLLLGVELELLLGLLMLLLFVVLLVLLLLFLTLMELEVLLLLCDELELGLTYSELERTWRLLLAGVYDLRSDEDEGLIEEELLELEGLLYLFCAVDTLSLADTLGDVVLMPLLDGLDGVVVRPSFLPLGDIPADEGLLLLLPAICKPLPPGCGLTPPPPG